jgi:hypothetical protein
MVYENYWVFDKEKVQLWSKPPFVKIYKNYAECFKNSLMPCCLNWISGVFFYVFACVIIGVLKSDIAEKGTCEFDLWISIDHSNADEKGSLIGDLIDKQGVRNSKGHPLFCLPCSVSHRWMLRNAFSVFCQLSVQSQVCGNRQNAPCNGIFIHYLCGVSFETLQNLQKSWFVFRGLNDILCVCSSQFCPGYTYLKHTCFRWFVTSMNDICCVRVCACVCERERETKSHPGYFHQH